MEKKNGKISEKGGRPKNSANIAQLIQDEAEGGFSAACADKLGLSKRAVQYSNTIAQNLPKDLRDKLQGTPAADNQSQLLKLAKLEPEKLKQAVKVIDTVEGDIAAAIDVLEDKKKVNRTKSENNSLPSLIHRIEQTKKHASSSWNMQAWSLKKNQGLRVC